MKTKYFAVSFNPSYYDVDEIRRMSLKEVKDFFEEDTENCKSIFEGNISDCDKLVPEGSHSDLDVLCVWFY